MTPIDAHIYDDIEDLEKTNPGKFRPVTQALEKICESLEKNTAESGFVYYNSEEELLEEEINYTEKISQIIESFYNEDYKNIKIELKEMGKELGFTVDGKDLGGITGTEYYLNSLFKIAEHKKSLISEEKEVSTNKSKKKSEAKILIGEIRNNISKIGNKYLSLRIDATQNDNLSFSNKAYKLHVKPLKEIVKSLDYVVGSKQNTTILKHTKMPTKILNNYEGLTNSQASKKANATNAYDNLRKQAQILKKYSNTLTRK